MHLILSMKIRTMHVKSFIAFLFIFCCLALNTMSGQSILTANEAVGLALENNFGIKLSENSEELARNNTSKYNSGKLPTVSLDGGGNYNLDNTSVKFQNGSTTKLTAASSYGANAAINVGYTLYDGMLRTHTMAQLQESFELSEIGRASSWDRVFRLV